MRKIQISVGALVEAVIHSGDLNLDFRESTLPIEGVRAQKRIQRTRPSSYEREVWISHQVERGRFEVKIQGRIDGVFTQTDPITLEEIKATRKDLEENHRQQGDQHWGQLQCYAYFYALEHGLSHAHGKLTYFQLETHKRLELSREFSLPELEEFFICTLDRFLSRLEKLETWNSRRDQSIDGLEFPFGGYRPGQRRMAVAVYQSLRDREQLLVQAPTGIGKTAASIFPAVKAMGKGLISRIYFLTARTTGRKAAEGATDILRDRGLELRSLSLTAKRKICFNPDRACTGEDCAFARGFYDRVDDALDRCLDESRLTQQEIERISRDFQVCPFELSLLLTQVSDLIICDYNYIFDPTAFLRGELEKQEDRCLIIDEAHNLVDRSRDMFSAELRKSDILAARRTVQSHLPGAARLLWRINRWFNHNSERFQKTEVSNSEPKGLESTLRDFISEVENQFDDTNKLERPEREIFFETYFQAIAFLRVLESSRDRPQDYVWCFQSDEEVRLKLLCRDTAQQIGTVLKRYRSSIFCSATLKRLASFQRLLGCSQTARKLTLSSPFKAEQVCFLVHDKIDTTYRQRGRSCGEVVDALGTFCSERTGNYMFFFPSYEYLELIHGAFARAFPNTDTVIQKPEMAEADRDDFLNQLEECPDATLACFTVLGGIFGESIDLTGERLSGAAIVSVGLPGLSTERDQLRSYFAERGEPGFDYAYALPGINRVLQAAGRVIRTETDRGAILLVDRRYGRAFYRRLLPAEWEPVFVRDSIDLKRELASFWSELSI